MYFCIKQCCFLEPIQMTPVQSSAALFRLDLGRDQYNLLREILTEHKACILVPWYRIQEFHKTTEPEGWTCELDSNGNAVFQVPMASVIHHHIRSILDDEVILARMQAHFAADPLVKFVLIFKYGADGANEMVVYRSRFHKQRFRLRIGHCSAQGRVSIWSDLGHLCQSER